MRLHFAEDEEVTQKMWMDYLNHTGKNACCVDPISL
jgi:hypothetical protein